MKLNGIGLLGMCLCVCLLGCTKGQTNFIVKDNTINNMKDSSDSFEKESDLTSEEKQAMSSNTENTTEEDMIFVYVCGHVKQPGVYSLAKSARICEALELAGGVSEDGNGEALEQAQSLVDGQTVYVPGIEEDVNRSEQTSTDVEDGLVNINTASVDELMTLTGIGEAKATIIYEYRMEHGTFSCVEDLMQIPGIKEGIYNKIKNQIKVQ